MKKGLDKEKIIAVSLDMMEKEGKENFSLHKLADALGIKTASLYNHVKSLEDVMTLAAARAIRMLVAAEKDSICSKTGDAAVAALAKAYYRFGLEHWQLYQLFMESRQPRSELLEKEGIKILDPILTAFQDYALPDEEKIHWERILRSLIHGFIAQEKAGFFTYGHISSEKSFQEGIRCFLAGLHQAESRAKDEI